MDEKRQIQKELFEEFVKTDKRRHPKGIFQPKPRRVITLSYEHMIFIVMAFIITASLFFALGVERGKRLEASSQTPVQMAKMPEPTQKEPAVAAQEEPAVARGEVRVQPKEPPRLKKEEAVASHPYTVQLASYVKKDTADKDARRLRKKGFQSFVLSSGDYYIVCVGMFNNKAKAASLQKKLRKLYPDCYVKKR